MGGAVEQQAATEESLYKPRWMSIAAGFGAIGLLGIIVGRTGSPWVAQWGVRMLFLGFLCALWGLTPAMGRLMAEDSEWDELSTKAQLLRATKWAFIGAVLLFILITIVSVVGR